MGKNVKQLLVYFQPKHYDIRLELDKTAATFTGEITLTGRKVGRPSKRLTFHQNGLKITEASAVKHDKNGDKTVPLSRLVHHKSYDEIRLHSDELLYPGSYTIEMKFEGKITAPMNGVYPCNFNHDGKKKQLLATQFESHHAREVFPCIDEPAAKATFQLTTESDAGETVLSNTPVQSQETYEGRALTKFETTPVMSTYLLAFVIGELAYRETTSKTGITIRAYATPDNVAYTEFALDVARQCLEFYDEYFGIAYPLAKCDFVALPDFASGAMENWGCITFREQTLLIDPEHSTLSTRQYVAMVVAHELAHQWFGNLVTMRWWTDLWLNEGFASWIEFLAIDTLFPTWGMWTQFISSEQQRAMRLDTLDNTHPVEVPVRHPDEIRSIFDAISYSKGASIIHMLHEYLGPEDFRTGLRHYLEKHAYNNTDTVDLWQALEDSSSKPVRSFMHAWTSQSGFPIVRAKVSLPEVTLSQSRFTTNAKKNDTPEILWPIPLLIPELPAEVQVLAAAQGAISYKGEQPFKLNRSQSGFYRVVYNSAHLQTLGHYIKKGKIEPLDRIGILSDILDAARYGYIDTVDALSFLEYEFDEDNFAVWEILSDWLGSLKLAMDDEELREAMKPFVRQLVSKQLARLGWNSKESDSHFDKLLRPIILGLAAAAEEEWVVKRCHELFEQIDDSAEVRPELRTVATPQEVKQGVIHPDLRGVVFGTVARHGDKKTFDKLVRLHDKAHLSEEKTTLAAAITGFRQPELAEESLGMITSAKVRLQDVPYWVAYSFINRHAKHKTWQWLKNNWDWLETNLGTDLSFYRMPLYAARSFSDPAFEDEFIAFFTPKLGPGLDRSYKQALEILRWQAAWKQRSLDTAKHYFTAKYPQ